MSNSEILREFLLETHENLALLDTDLVKLEENPGSRETLAEVFRTFHSVKGTAGFMGLGKLQTVAHSAESLLSRLRAGEIRFNRPIATVLLRVVDAIREIVTNIETSGGEGTADYSSLSAEVDWLRQTGGESTSDSNPGSASSVSLVDASLSSSSSAAVPILRGTTPANGPPAVQPSLPPATVAAASTPVVSAAPQVSSTPLAVASVAAVPGKPAPVVPAPVVPAPVVPTPIASSEVPAPLTSSGSGSVTMEMPEVRASNVADAAIRVDVGLLDKLMTLAGELVLARNQILQYSEEREDSGFLSAVQRLNRLTTELQANVMKTRMQPIGNVLTKLPRVVRDLAVACGKKVQFEMDGQDTELDKTLIEAIRDPLTHMIRNAIDHGIEPPEVRVARGKTEEGRLRVVAFHEGGKVIVEISDDGAGIDVSRVREKAIAHQLISPEVASRMTHRDLLRLIFAPGFSTADRVTQFSGRGVGMDVVRTNIEKIGGSVDIESLPGQGTTIRTKIPLTLAIIPALVIVSGGERFAIPQVSLLELVRLDAEQAARGVERISGAPVYRLRGELLPLVFLDDQLELDRARGVDDDLCIVVLQADDRPFGLVVDSIRDTAEIVVKPLQKQLKGIPLFAGASIMGDGRVALVLDVLGLAQRAGVVSGAKSHAIPEAEPSEETLAGESQSLLLFSPGGDSRMAIPLSLVARLEEFPRSRLELVGGREVVQYRGEILPLVDVSRTLDKLRRGGSRSSEPRAGNLTTSPTGVNEQKPELVSVVVCAEGQQRVGLVVSRILDVVNESILARSDACRPGTLFSAVVQDRVTEFLDVGALLRESSKDFLPTVT